MVGCRFLADRRAQSSDRGRLLQRDAASTAASAPETGILNPYLTPSMRPPSAIHDPFPPHRWAGLARGAGLAATEPLAIALSGGIGSSALVALAAAAHPRPELVAVHVGGATAEAETARELCRHLGVRWVPLEGVQGQPAPLDAVCAWAAQNAYSTIALGDVRPTGEVGGWIHVAARERRGHQTLVRPLRCLSRGELRAALQHVHLPFVDEAEAAAQRAHPLALVGADVLRMDAELAAATALIVWDAPVHLAARRGVTDGYWGGSLARGVLMALPRALRRRVLARLLHEGIGTFVQRAVLEHAVEMLSRGRTARVAMPHGWSLVLRSDRVLLEPPRVARGVHPQQLSLPFDDVWDNPAPSVELTLPGLVALDDGRSIRATVQELGPNCAPLARRLSVELDPRFLPQQLAVRFPRPGDRFHPLGWPKEGSLHGFLAAAGVPREGRERVPIVLADERVVWVAGLRVAEFARVEPRTRARLRLDLVHPLVADAEL